MLEYAGRSLERKYAQRVRGRRHDFPGIEVYRLLTLLFLYATYIITCYI